jgi:hypothetical protein
LYCVAFSVDGDVASLYNNSIVGWEADVSSEGVRDVVRRMDGSRDRIDGAVSVDVNGLRKTSFGWSHVERKHDHGEKKEYYHYCGKSSEHFLSP